MNARSKSYARWWPVILIVAAVGALAVLRALRPEVAQSARPGWRVVRPPHDVHVLALQGDLLWAGGRDGLTCFNRHTVTPVPLPPGAPDLVYVKGILVDRQGVLWLAHRDGLARHDDGTWSTFSEADGLLPGPATALLEARDGMLWIGGEVGLVRYDGKSFTPFTDESGPGAFPVGVMAQDRSGAIWVGGAAPTRGGLFRFDAAGWTDYSATPGLVHRSVNDILEARDGTLWFATGFANRGGASRLSVAGAWTRLTREDGLAGGVARSLFEDDDGRFWIGSEFKGMAVSADTGWQVFSPADGLAGWEVKDMLQDSDGVYWLGTDKGLTRIARVAAPGQN